MPRKPRIKRSPIYRHAAARGAVTVFVRNLPPDAARWMRVQCAERQLTYGEYVHRLVRLHQLLVNLGRDDHLDAVELEKIP